MQRVPHADRVWEAALVNVLSLGDHIAIHETGLFAAPILGGAGDPALADLMHAHWTRFVKTGDAGWEPCELATRATMRFDTTSALVNDPWQRGGGSEPASLSNDTGAWRTMRTLR